MEKYGIKRIVTCEMLDRHPEARSYVVEEMTRELVGEIVPELHEGEKIVKLSNVREFQEWEDYQRMTVQLGRIVTIDSLIRCKDCRWWGREDVFKDGSKITSCKKGWSTDECGYCYKAERRTDE